MIRLSLFEIASSKTTLAGSAMGRQMLAKLIGRTKPVGQPTVAYLDFTGIDIATGSFLREAVLGFRDFSRNAMGTLYPVVANANSTIEEELSIYLADRNDAIWACALSATGDVRQPHIIGKLDASHQRTLGYIVEHRSLSAPELARLQPEEGIGATGWNNRLSNLASKSILMEFKSGKSKSFSSVLETV
jgi:hypothetical protein